MRRHTLTPLCAALAAAVLSTACDVEEPHGPDTEDAHDATAASPGPPGGLPPVTGPSAFTWTTDEAFDEDVFVSCPPDPDNQSEDFWPDGCELAPIQGNPAEENADVFFKLEPGETVPKHWHTSNERMVLVSGEMEVDYEGQDPVTLTPGVYAYGPAELPHETHCLGAEGDKDCILFIAFEEAVDAIEVAEREPDEIPDEEAFIETTDDALFGPCPGFMPESCELAFIQVDGDPEGDPEGVENADVFFKLDPGTKVPMHWHSSAERMVLVSGEMQVNYLGQRPTLLDPMTYAYGPSGLEHDTRCKAGGDDCILFIAFEEPVDAIDVRGGNQPHHPDH